MAELELQSKLPDFQIKILYKLYATPQLVVYDMDCLEKHGLCDLPQFNNKTPEGTAMDASLR